MNELELKRYRDAERLVQTDVYYCVSTLIYELSQDLGNSPPRSNLNTYQDELYDLGEVRDYEESVGEYIRSMDVDDILVALDELDVSVEEDFRNKEELQSLLIASLEDQDGTEQFALERDIEPYSWDIYEHWLVSGWLAEQLTKKGHVVREVFGLTVWGRPTTGQSIALDGVIQDIAAETYA